MQLFTLLLVMAVFITTEADDDLLSSFFQAYLSRFPNNPQSRLKSLSNSTARKRKHAEEDYSALSRRNQEERLSQGQQKPNLGNRADKNNGVKGIQSSSSEKSGRVRVKGQTDLNEASVTTPSLFETNNSVEHIGTVTGAVTGQTTERSHDVASVLLNGTNWSELANLTSTKEQNMTLHFAHSRAFNSSKSETDKQCREGILRNIFRNRTFVMMFMVGVIIFLLLLIVLIIIGLTYENFARNKKADIKPDWDYTVTEPSGGEKEPEPPLYGGMTPINKKKGKRGKKERGDVGESRNERSTSLPGAEQGPVKALKSIERRETCPSITIDKPRRTTQVYNDGNISIDMTG